MINKKDLSKNSQKRLVAHQICIKTQINKQIEELTLLKEFLFREKDETQVCAFPKAGGFLVGKTSSAGHEKLHILTTDGQIKDLNDGMLDLIMLIKEYNSIVEGIHVSDL